MNEKEWLDQRAPAYGSPMGVLSTRLISQFTYKLIKDRVEGRKVLLLGLGDGYIINNLAERQAFDITVLEGSMTLIKNYSHLKGQCRILHTLFENFIDWEAFDTIIATHILEHVEDPLTILGMARQALNDKGIAIFTVPNAHSLHRRVGVKMKLLKFERELNKQDLEIGHRRVFAPAEFRSTIESAGFELEHFQGYLLKIISNEQMATWSSQLLDALFSLSLELPLDICASMAAFCRRGTPE